MEKPAVTTTEIHPLLARRWSPRSFSSQKVDPQTLKRIFEAARWAPSSFNDQPWRFIVGQKGDPTYSRIMETLVEFNQKWASTAPVLILAVGKTVSSKTGKPNSAFRYDTGQSIAYITFQAMHEGLFAHQMGGFDADKARQLFQIPEEYQPLTVTAIGYKEDPSQLEEDFRKMEVAPRQRIPLEEIVFADTFGEKFAW